MEKCDQKYFKILGRVQDLDFVAQLHVRREVAYRTSTSLRNFTYVVKERLRKLSHKITLEMDIKLEDFLADDQALAAVIHELNLQSETAEYHALYTVCLFTYVGEWSKNVSIESHELIPERVIYIIKLIE